ncbi:hypothetical protein [Sporosarcina sp. Marseille-Q4943]|uniref:hypothetical protein n=1 Tax=Sporosarcina sp. Marseille-Q4943 TaxID=2942204 RepID=UPI00208DA95E|nr:hypothetical protein [Sporosarcina sp. Marseille-Q4943]
MTSAARQKGSHVLLESANVKWYWDGYQLIEFRKMWRDGASIHDIAAAFKVSLLTVALLAADQELAKNIKPRPGGLFGN